MITGPAKNLRIDTKMMRGLRFPFNHIDKKSNEIILSKCVRPHCLHCTSNPIISVNAWNELQRSSFKWPNPVNSETFPGHFKTFQEVEQDPSAFICSDKGLPFSLNVRECEECNYMFMSAV